MFDPSALWAKCIDPQRACTDEELNAARVDFCNQFIAELQKMKGEGLEPCLSSMTVQKKERCVDVVLRFSL